MNVTDILALPDAARDERGMRHWQKLGFASCDATLAKTPFAVELAAEWVPSEAFDVAKHLISDRLRERLAI
jgi:hypothetical protein